jgi:lysophospholipase L1-like esterase
LIDLLQDKDIHVAVLLHETRSELESGADPGQKAIKQVCSQAGIKPINLGPAFKQSIDRGEDPYRDDGLHPNDIGQRLIYEELRQAVAAELGPER